MEPLNYQVQRFQVRPLGMLSELIVFQFQPSYTFYRTAPPLNFLIPLQQTLQVESTETVSCIWQPMTPGLHLNGSVVGFCLVGVTVYHK